jgi:hypothetical protein
MRKLLGIGAIVLAAGGASAVDKVGDKSVMYMVQPHRTDMLGVMANPDACKFVSDQLNRRAKEDTFTGVFVCRDPGAE